LRITSIDPAISFSESCHTVLVNPRGCGIRFARPLKPGLRVRVEGLPCGGSVTAQVASNLAPGEGSKYWLVGIGLDSAGNLWCMAPTPQDWGTYATVPKFTPFATTRLPDSYSASEARLPQK